MISNYWEIQDQIQLEKILTTLRLKYSSSYNYSYLPGIPADLYKLCQSHSPKGSLSIKSNPNTAASIALINHILQYQLTIYNGTVALLDFTGNFTVSHLQEKCGTEALNHLYIFRPPRASKEIFEAVKQWMLFEKHASLNRVWVGTIIIGAKTIGEWNGAEKVLVSCGRNGWMKVARDDPTAFAKDVSVEEAWSTRPEKDHNVRWKAWCEEGDYKWS